MTEIKPCPFCKVASKTLDEHEEDCFLRNFERDIHPVPYDFIAHYNTRPIEDSLQDEINYLTAERDGYKSCVERLEQVCNAAQSEIDKLKAQIPNNDTMKYRGPFPTPVFIGKGDVKPFFTENKEGEK